MGTANVVVEGGVFLPRNRRGYWQHHHPRGRKPPIDGPLCVWELTKKLNTDLPMSDTLSMTFSALADPTRRAMLERLARGAAHISELARPFLKKMSLPAVTKHVKVLEKAGLGAHFPGQFLVFVFPENCRRDETENLCGSGQQPDRRPGGLVVGLAGEHRQNADPNRKTREGEEQDSAAIAPVPNC